MKHLMISILACSWVVFAVGCHRVSDVADGGPDTDTDTDSDTDTDADTDVDADTDSPIGWGKVRLNSYRAADSWGVDALWLSAGFYEEEQPFFDEAYLSESVTSTDGVSCDIFVFTDGGYGDPPTQYDGGEIRAGLHGGGDYLSVTFEGEGYSVDSRYEGDTDPAYPEWMGDEPPTFFFDGLGSDDLGLFSVSSSLTEFPIVVIPSYSGANLFANSSGDYQIYWSADEADEIRVTIHFNMDWNDSYIVCSPPASASSLLVSHEWVDDYSWGGFGDIEIWSISSKEVHVSEAVITTEASRIIATSANFVI